MGITARNFTKKIIEKLKSNYYIPVTEQQIFSTEETVIGVWTDGKPLYRKIVSCGALPNNTTKSVPHNITNIDKILGVEGIAIKPSDSTSIPLPYAADTGNTILVNAKGGVNAVTREITIKTFTDRSSFTNSYIAILYTKTTDTAATSKVPFEPMIEYSTEERLIGYWIDGNPLYRKVFSGVFGAITNGTRSTVTVGNIANVGTVVKIDAVIQGGGSAIQFPHVVGSSSAETTTPMLAHVEEATGDVKAGSASSAHSGRTIRVIVEYTKTT